MFDPEQYEREPIVTVSMSRKVNMGNYESADVFVAVSGVRAGMTTEEIAPLMDTAKVAWDLCRSSLIEQIKALPRQQK